MERTGREDRIKAAIAAAALQALLVYVLIAGLGVTIPAGKAGAPTIFRILPDPPPPEEKIIPPPVRNSRPEGEAAPPNIRSKATEIVAPERRVELIVPPNIVAAPQADVGSDPSSGAADVPGPGAGAGGEGDGRGGGGYGDGDGGGRRTPPRWRKGRLRDSDYPAAAREAMAGGTVTVLYTIATNGRVTQCEVERSSGNAALDETTCRLIQERFRYEPSRDARGRPVQSRMIANHEWVVDESEATAMRDER